MAGSIPSNAPNTSVLPLDSRLIVTSSLEAVRAEIFALLSLKGWQYETKYPESNEELDQTLTDEIDDLIVIVAETDVSLAERSLQTALDAGLSSERLILGATPNLLAHRILARVSKARVFTYDYQITATGPKVDLGQLPLVIMQVVSGSTSQCLDSEIRIARETGGLSLLSVINHHVNDTTALERAALTSALLHYVTGKLATHKAAIRYALYFELPKVTGWRTIVSSARHLWTIKEMLESRSELVLGKGLSSWSATIELSTLAAECAQHIIETRHLGNKEALRLLKERLAQQPLELRAALCEAAKKVCTSSIGANNAAASE